MKNLFFAFIAILCIGAISSCGDDDSCTQSDFVGTYSIVGDSTCVADNSITGPLTFTLTAGTTENTVLENGEEDLVLNIIDCTASDEFISYTLDGENVTAKLGECAWTYKKN